MTDSEPKMPSVGVAPWMMAAACRVIHGKQPHADWTGARPEHLPEQACEWAAMAIAEEAPPPSDSAFRAAYLEAAEWHLSRAAVAKKSLSQLAHQFSANHFRKLASK